MSRRLKLLSLAEEHFDEGEIALASVLGQFETERLGSDSIKTGVLIATDRRVVFFAKRMFGYELEHFSYRAISSFEHGKRFMGGYVKIISSGNDVKLKWISDGDIAEFAAVVRAGIEKKASS